MTGIMYHDVDQDWQQKTVDSRYSAHLILVHFAVQGRSSLRAPQRALFPIPREAHGSKITRRVRFQMYR